MAAKIEEEITPLQRKGARILFTFLFLAGTGAVWVVLAAVTSVQNPTATEVCIRIMEGLCLTSFFGAVLLLAVAKWV